MSDSEPQLHVFDDGFDLYLAHDEEEAARLRCEWLDEDTHQEPFTRLEPEFKLKVLCDRDGERSDHGKPVERTCAEWARIISKPDVLCSRDI